VRQVGLGGPQAGWLEGIAGVAEPICDCDVRAVAALSVGTISARLNEDRLPTVVELLKREAVAIGPKINLFDAMLRRPAGSLSSGAQGVSWGIGKSRLHPLRHSTAALLGIQRCRRPLRELKLEGECSTYLSTPASGSI
jgi:hypothetical protein